jgi:hypothetical protein
MFRPDKAKALIEHKLKMLKKRDQRRRPKWALHLDAGKQHSHGMDGTKECARRVRQMAKRNDNGRRG